jgi:hypothetical protein
MGHTSFGQKQTKFTSFVPKGDAGAPKKATVARAKAEALQQNARQMPGISIFEGVYISKRMSAVKTAFVRTANI